MFEYKLIVTYDGTSYFGWQKTKSGPSIQECLEGAIAQICGEKRLPEAASRTDRGVHAAGQVVQFCLEKSWEPERLQRGLNGVLPHTIRVVSAERAKAGFHPTLDAVGKEYRYSLSQGLVQDPTQRLYSWHIKAPLDLGKMRHAANALLGTHDFSALAGEKETNPVCTIQAIEFEQNGEQLKIQVIGDRFLYKMVRNIVGTLVYVGCGKLAAGCIPGIIASKDRKLAGVTAPAHGLVLMRVDYDFKK